MPNVTVDIHAGEERARAERIRERNNAAKLTQFTFVQNTNGAGFRQIGFVFDVTFTSEPVFTYGCHLVSISALGYLPAGAAIVTHWVQDADGRFNGVVLVVQVTLAGADGFAYSSKTRPGPQATAKVVVAHNLTFSAPALPRSKADTTLAIDTLTALTTGIT